MKIALVDKCPSNTNYSKHFGIPDLAVFHMTDASVKKVYKKDITIGTPQNPFNPHDYDFVILVGADPFKHFTKRTGISDYTGKLVEDQGYAGWIPSISPAQLHFKPEMRPVFEETVNNIDKIITGKLTAPKPGNYRPIVDEQDAFDYVNMLVTMTNPATTPLAFDSETSGLYARNCYVLGLSISHEEYQGVYIDADVISERVTHKIQVLFDQKDRPIVFHNLKFDQHMYTYHFGLSYEKAYDEKRLHDTMLIHYILDERKGTHGLKQLAMNYTDMGDYDFELDKFKEDYCKKHKIKKADFTYDLIPFDIMWPYASKDTDATLRIFNKFYPKIVANPQFLSLYQTIIMPGCRFLQRVEDRGVPINVQRLNLAHQLLTDKLNEYVRKLYEFEEVKTLEREQGSRFNPNSVVQLRVLLFDILGLTPTGKLTEAGAISTDAESLMEIAEQHPIANILLQIRKTTKLISTYVEKVLQSIDSDGRIRTGFHLHTTTSGRLSSSGKMNLQQLPRDESIIKGCIYAPPGYKVVAYDLTTAEIYYAAVLSGDKNMQQVFINMTRDPDTYPDFHATIAHMVFKLPCEPREVKKLFPALRQAAKAISFGILYGSGPAKVAEAVNEALLEQSAKTGEPFEPCTPAKANEYIADYFNKFTELKRWIDRSHDQIKQFGFIYSHYGRKRRLLNINSEDRGIASGEVRSGFNAIIQGASSDSLLLGAIHADLEIERLGLLKEMQIIMLVHDSVVAIVREDLIDQYSEILIRNIQEDRGLSIKGCPIGVGMDSEEGGSVDYSCGKLRSQHPAIAVIGDPDFEATMRSVMERVAEVGAEDIVSSIENKRNLETIEEQFPELKKIIWGCDNFRAEWNFLVEGNFPWLPKLDEVA